MDKSEFTQLMNKRWKTKSKNKKIKDRNGDQINFLLSKKEYFEIFFPYKEDKRLYLNHNDRNRLCLCRFNDLGNYTIDNVYVDTKYNNALLGLHKIESKNKAKEKLYEKYPNGTWYGRKHKDETKQKMIEAHSKNNHQQGVKNNSYGTCWIYNLELKENKKINKKYIDIWLNNNWIKGRKMNFK
jgi:hypothetical protein